MNKAGLVAAVALMASGCSEAASVPSPLEAEGVCENFIERRLKAPSTADYDLTATGGPTTFTVSGSVDAENAFGAKLRRDVSCEVTLVGDRWRLDSLTGLG